MDTRAYLDGYLAKNTRYRDAMAWQAKQRRDKGQVAGATRSAPAAAPPASSTAPQAPSPAKPVASAVPTRPAAAKTTPAAGRLQSGSGTNTMKQTPGSQGSGQGA